MLTGDLFPVGLVVRGRPCLVVGGGTVAARKIGALLGCGALVTAVAPEVHPTVARLARLTPPGAPAAPTEPGAPAAPGAPTEPGAPTAPGAPGSDSGTLEVHRRPYRRGEVAGYRLVIAATGVLAVDRAVWEDADAAGIWVNCADDPAHCSVVLPAVHRDGPVTVAVSTGGTSPALASWARTVAAGALGPHVGDLARLLGETRQELHDAGASTEGVDWVSVLDGPLPALVDAGRFDEARALLHALVAPLLAPAAFQLPPADFQLPPAAPQLPPPGGR